MTPLASAHLVYNAVLLLAVAGAVAAARRRPGRAWLLAAPALLAGGLLLAGLAVAGVRLVLPDTGLFALLGLFACAVFAHAPLLLLGLAWTHRRARPVTAGASLATALAILAVAAWSFLVEPHRIEVTRVRIESPKLAQPLRIAVLADLQTNRVGEHERRAVRLAMAERPDLILLPGDFVQTTRALHRGEREALRRVFAEEGLAAPLGVLAVRGNVDPDEWPEIFAGLPARCLDNETLEVGGAGGPLVTGLDMPQSFDTRLRVPSGERFHVVFGHGPDFALGDVRADLLVAGHCHGGQVRLPFLGPLLTLSRVPRAWTSGAREVRPGTWLVVSRGIGLERAGAPPLRFLCPPEVVVVDVVPAGAGAPASPP